jgi:metabolite-proton symporter
MTAVHISRCERWNDGGKGECERNTDRNDVRQKKHFAGRSFFGHRIFMTKPASPRRILGASMVGTAVEFYDFYIYATAAALVFGPLFFPSETPGLAQMASYASFAVAFFARPLGAVAFGHYGDRVGRKSTLVASLMIMGVSTFLIAFLPTYAVIGWLAPVLLCLLRFGQGFGLGGEWGGAALLAVENAPPGKRGIYGIFPQLGAPIGFIVSNGFFLLLGLWLSDDQFMDWGWRIPFLGSALLVIIGLWVRLRLTETPAFAAARAEAAPPKVPLTVLFRDHWPEVLGGTCAAIACFAIFYLTTAFALGYGIKTLGIPRETFLIYQLIAIFFLAGGIIASGFLTDRFSGRAVLMAGCLITIPVALLIEPLMTAGAGGIIAFLSIALFSMGLVYGPLGSWLPGLFPPLVRYSGASVTFNMAGILGGGLAPLLAQSLADTQGLWAVGYYLAACAVASLVGLVMLKR